jgi:hypothetical protein
MIETNFGWALQMLKEWKSLTRTWWNWDHKITLQVPDTHSKMTKPYIYINTVSPFWAVSNKWDVEYDRVPWLASQTDMLAWDWEVVE